MSAAAKALAKKRRWLSRALKGGLILPAVLALAACGLTTSSSNSNSLLASGAASPAATRKITLVNNAPNTPSKSVKTAAKTEALPEAKPAQAAAKTEALPEAAPPPAESAAEAAVALAAPAEASPPSAAPAEAETAAAATVDDGVPHALDSALATIQMLEVVETGLIDQSLFTAGLTRNLTTGQAGQGLLRDNGIKSAYTLSGDITAASSYGLAYLETGEADPAPSAGASEAVSLNASTLAVVNDDAASVQVVAKGGLTESLLMTAYEQTGRHFNPGGQSPDAGFDDSGFTRWVYAQNGVKLPKDALRQANGGHSVARENLRPGDILVYRDPDGAADNYHVGIYTGHGNFLHAAAKTGVVSETAAFGPQYLPYFVDGRRYYDDPKAAPLSDVQKMSATSSAVKLALSELGPNDQPERSKAKKTSKPAAKKKTSTKSKGG